MDHLVFHEQSRVVEQKHVCHWGVGGVYGCVCVPVQTFPKPLVKHLNISGRLKQNINLSAEPASDKKVSETKRLKKKSTMTTCSRFTLFLLKLKTITVYLTKGFKRSAPALFQFPGFNAVLQKRPRHVRDPHACSVLAEIPMEIG